MTLSLSTNPSVRATEPDGDMRILIVEDEALNALYMASVLESHGYSVSSAASGEAAIEAATEQKPDLVLMDVSLHGSIDGVDTALALRRQFELPVVFVTAHGDPRTRRRAAAADPVGYLTKPFSSMDLITAVEAALEVESGEQRFTA